MSIKINQTEQPKNILNAMRAMNADMKINLGIEEIEFPDGSKETFYYNGEDDKEAAVHFAQICIDVCAGDSNKAKAMMATCYLMLANNYDVDEIISSEESEIDTETYIDYKKGVLLTPEVEVLASLTEDELKVTKGKKNALAKSLLLERARAEYGFDALSFERAFLRL